MSLLRYSDLMKAAYGRQICFLEAWMGTKSSCLLRDLGIWIAQTGAEEPADHDEYVPLSIGRALTISL